MNTHIYIFIYTYIYIYIVQILIKYASPSTTLKEEAKAFYKKHFLVTFHPPPHGRYLFHRGAHLPRAPRRHFGVRLFRKCGNLGWNGGLRSHVALQCGVFMCLGPCGRRFVGVSVIQVVSGNATKIHEVCCGIQFLMLRCMLILRDFP